LFRAWGPVGLVLLKSAAVLALVLLMATRLRREGHGPAGQAVLLVPALVGASFRLDVRPELATLLLAPLVLMLLQRARDDGRLAPLLAVPAIAALWANLHPGVILVPAMLSAAAALTLVMERWPFLRLPVPAGAQETGSHPPPRFGVRLAWVALAGAVAVTCNPYGTHLYRVPFELSRLLSSLPSPNLEWARPEPAQFPMFYLGLAAAVVVTLLGVRRIDPLTTPALALAGVLSVLHLRNIGLFFLLLPIGLARPLRGLVEAAQRSRVYRASTAGGRVRPGFVAAAVTLVAGVPLLLYVPPVAVWGLGVAPGNEPRSVVDTLQRVGAGRRLFNDVRFGGYLIWRRWPEHPVFIDGRNEVHASLLREIFGAMADPASWRTLLDRYAIDAALVRYPSVLRKVVYAGRNGGPAVADERPFSAVYFPRSDWAVIDWDDDSTLLLRRTDAQREVIERLEYRALQPDDWRHAYAAARVGAVPIGPLLDDIDRKLRDDPRCLRARQLRDLFGRLQAKIGSRQISGRPGAG
ncbi:MAG TPA: hypothetical protein VNL37_08340, partial [Candidatus Polarisedimenticolia bacterium]|nr:hypothetical protein [Candidatus Polarisedimenticolia bacterium]